MNRLVLRSKIHRATVTEANLDYEGSVTIDSGLLEAADIAEFEQVHIYDVTSGSRVITYAMVGPPGTSKGSATIVAPSCVALSREARRSRTCT